MPKLASGFTGFLRMLYKIFKVKKSPSTKVISGIRNGIRPIYANKSAIALACAAIFLGLSIAKVAKNAFAFKL